MSNKRFKKRINDKYKVVDKEKKITKELREKRIKINELENEQQK